LQGVVTFTEKLARQQAEAADALLARGIYRGPLHGIPYGLKDIIAVRFYRTTWGDPAYEHQYIDQDANVYVRWGLSVGTFSALCYLSSHRVDLREGVGVRVTDL
jgi:Asp-tRNA(Asn)/Glu-tRNA(Gln) amidotransferase A subunit family amidase